MKRFWLTFALCGPILAAPLVQNGGFETGDLGNWTYDGSFDVSAANAHAGVYSASFQSAGPSTLQQTVAVAAGGSYELSFDLANFGIGANSFSVSFDGTTIDSVSNAGTFNYTTVRIANLSAATASANLEFALSGGGWAIDNVKLTRMDQLLQNGGFETGNYSGWQRVSTYSTPPNTNFVTEGGYAARLGTKGQVNGPRGSLTQSLETEAGREYQVSFWLRSPVYGAKELTATFGGQTAVDYTRANEQVANTRYSGVFEATGNATELRFTEKNQGFWYLDDVRVSLVAEPDVRLSEAILNAPKLTTSPVSTGADAPEPQSLLLVGSGLLVAAAAQRRRRRSAM